MINVRKGYTFDDLLMVPRKSAVSSRRNVDLSVDWGKGIKTTSPIINANMADIASCDLVSKLACLGGMGLLHRFTEDKIGDYKKTIDLTPNDYRTNIGVSVGINDDEKEFLKQLNAETNCKIVCVDIAHAHSEKCLEFINYIKSHYNNLLIIAGNVATAFGARDLMEAGADVIKCGIGGGSICSTRDTTGSGVPQMTCISDIADELHYYIKNNTVRLISDGGLKTSGNISKALVYTSGVMLGSLLAGCSESSGQTVEINGLKWKEYRGSSTHKKDFVEGITSRVLSKGSLDDTVSLIHNGIRSACSYQGVFNLNDLKTTGVEFIEISNAGIIESKTHSKLEI